MSERIYKLQPDRTIQLRGFDSLGASAALHHATPSGFEVSGTFRDSADFAVLMLWDADNFFEHPRIKYLPDPNFAGLTLRFDVAYENLMPLDCRKFPTIDWPYLDVQPMTGDAFTVRLVDPDNPVIVSGQNTPASASFTILGDNLDAFDRLTLWYQNLAFDYIVPGKLRTEFPFYAAGAGTVHTISIAGRSYSYTEQPNDASAAIAAALIALINAGQGDADAAATTGSQSYFVRLERKLDTGDSFSVAASGSGADTLYHVKSTTVTRDVARQIRDFNWAPVDVPFHLDASAVGDVVLIHTRQTGFDANFLRMYAVSKNSRLTTVDDTAVFSGGSSNAVFRVTIDFSKLASQDIRQMWLTFAPRPEYAAHYATQEWRAVFSNWSLTGPEDVRRLQVATADSVRIGSSDARCEYSPVWTQEEGFYYGNFARGISREKSTVTIRYSCPKPHDLWLGTSLYHDRGSAGVVVDGAVWPDLPCTLPLSSPPVNTRRRIATAIAAGDHVVTLTTRADAPFYFDFLEAVVGGELPDPLPASACVSPALDYSTDHTYKLPPDRILWNFEQLGFAGPIDQYLGVFWWNQRANSTRVLGQTSLTFTGGFAAGDAIFLDIGGVVCGKPVFPGESNETIARHFAFLINAAYVGVWAEWSGAILTLHSRSAHADYNYDVLPTVQNQTGSTGAVTPQAARLQGDLGLWVIDPSQDPPLNRGARDWHGAFYEACASRGLVPTTACSMELVYPPDDFPARFPNQDPVTTSMGFGGIFSTHCAFSPPMLAYQQRVYRQLATLMQQAGLTPSLQCGEFTWWYFSNFPTLENGGMAYYDAATQAAAQIALGRPLALFRLPTDDPLVNDGADSAFLRDRLRDYVASLIASVRSEFPQASFEVLFPYDVNHPYPAGVHQLGGPLNLAVSLPTEWKLKETSGFDRFRIEALDFGAWSRDLTLATDSLRFPLELGWPPSSVRAILPIFRGGYPWWRELRYALDLNFEAINLWAFDHIGIYGVPLSGPTGSRSSRQGR